MRADFPSPARGASHGVRLDKFRTCVSEICCFGRLTGPCKAADPSRTFSLSSSPGTFLPPTPQLRARPKRLLRTF